MEGHPHVIGKCRSALGCSQTFGTLVPLRKVLSVVCSPHTDLGSLGKLPLAQQQGCSAGEQRVFKQRNSWCIVV